MTATRPKPNGKTYIYKITGSNNEILFVGSSSLKLKGLIESHKYYSNDYSNFSTISLILRNEMANSKNKNIDHLKYEVIEKCANIDLTTLETRKEGLIKLLNPLSMPKSPIGYNKQIIRDHNNKPLSRLCIEIILSVMQETEADTRIRKLINNNKVINIFKPLKVPSNLVEISKNNYYVYARTKKEPIHEKLG